MDQFEVLPETPAEGAADGDAVLEEPAPPGPAPLEPVEPVEPVEAAETIEPAPPEPVAPPEPMAAPPEPTAGPQVPVAAPPDGEPVVLEPSESDVDLAATAAPVAEPAPVDLGGQANPVAAADPVGGLTIADTVAGDPSGDSQYWVRQSQNGFCGPASITQIVAEFTGQVPTSDMDVVNRAIDRGWLEKTPDGRFDGWSGMTLDETELLLESYGVPAHTEQGTLATLSQYLEGDYSVMAFIDGDEVWTGADDDATDAGRGLNHFLIVTGVDETAGVVYLNDPAVAHGRGWQVPLDRFLDAWADGDNQMLVTDVPAPAEAPAPTPTPTPTPAPAPGPDAPLPTPDGAELPAPGPETPAPTPEPSPAPEPSTPVPDLVPEGNRAVLIPVHLSTSEVVSVDTGETYRDTVTLPLEVPIETAETPAAPEPDLVDAANDDDERRGDEQITLEEYEGSPLVREAFEALLDWLGRLFR